MNRMTTTQFDATLDERLANSYDKSGRNTPLFLVVAGIGIFVIYKLASLGILGDPAPKLLYVSWTLFFLALAQWLALFLLARRGRGFEAYLLSALSVAITAIVVTMLWQGIFYIATPLVLAVPLAALRKTMSRRNTFWFIILILFSVAGIFVAEYLVRANIKIERIALNSSAAFASLAFLGATSLLLITITVFSQNRNFKSLQGLLLTSFVIIVTIPTVMTTVLSWIGTYANSQAQTFNTLKAISALKEDQISHLIDELKNDAVKIQEDAVFKQNILPVINPEDNSSEQTSLYRNLARSYLQSIQKDGDVYSEIMILDTKGVAVISTEPKHEGLIYETQLFYRQGTVKVFTGFANIPDSNGESLVMATPLFDENGQIIRGVIVLRSDSDVVREIMENTPGFAEAETYLVDKDYNPITQTRTTTKKVRTEAAYSAIIDNRDGQGTYDNYASVGVLGYYKWYESMQVAIIAESPINFVVTSSVRSLTGSSLLALFIIAIAIVAVAISARSIADPITQLARTTESLAAGNFSARANVDRKDEIGALANAYNQMAGQLQDIIGKLEQRVADRTKELENQTLRLRVAAEIARDAASARNLNELLDSAAMLIVERFHFYHTGIFLINKTREFAILTASTTKAGKQMIANGYRIRLGESNIVGRVAASGEQIIRYDMDADQINMPLLPNTRSEMALPLKVGNNVIGVLDVHGDQPHAFTQDDTAIMQVMADQIATAIERAQLLQEVERNLKELETAYGQYTIEGWQRLEENRHPGNYGYRFDNVRIEPITEASNPAGDPSQTSTTSKDTITIPIKLRGQVIGMVAAKLKEGHNPRTVSTLEAATDRLAAALESARLYEEARARADREQAIARVTSKISTETDFEAILRATVEEVGRSLGNSDVSIQITGDSEE